MTDKKVSFRFRRENIYLILVFAFFMFMMIFHLTHSALWEDEWVEYSFSQASILNGDMYHRIISTYQPPLYNFLMHFWLKFDQSVLWFRSFNILLGCISGIFLFCTIKKLLNERTAMVMLCVLAVTYQWVYCIQECSEYALMLSCMFASIYFYVKTWEKFRYIYMILFLLCSVSAIYSQYGSVFIILPLLLLFFIKSMIDQDINKREKLIIFASYVVCLMIFAIPLCVLFLKTQLENNQISENTITLTIDLLRDFPFTLGNIIGYFFNLNSGNIWPVLFGIAGLFLLGTSVFAVINNRRMPWTKKSLIITLWIGYSLHYILVQKHIYAMVHPGVSGGFFSRYSYFYIPFLCIVTPVILNELYNLMPSVTKQTFKFSGIAMIITSLILSMYSTLQNWNKTFDDQFAEIWMENEGWNDITYLYGRASNGFNYYVSHSDGYKESYMNNVTSNVDNNKLPLRFWAWRTNGGGDYWKETIDKATTLGYTVNIFRDSGGAGQLAYCSYDNEIDEFNMNEISLAILNAEFADDGLLHVKLQFRDPTNTDIEYNTNDYRISYHLLNSNKNIIAWNNDMVQINSWINYSESEIVIDTSQIEQENYMIQFDIIQRKDEWLSDKGLKCPSISIQGGQIIMAP